MLDLGFGLALSLGSARGDELSHGPFWVCTATETFTLPGPTGACWLTR
ncbi:MAG: hypothetical protein M0P73_16250 [Syntrophobacterales bacterium]|jgi:hypothetical protein|nr:hypothetical protein [Syntrophobacterales bacterium]